MTSSEIIFLNASLETGKQIYYQISEISMKHAKNGLEIKEDDDEDSGDNILTMLLKPSYTTQDSSKTQPEENLFYEDEGAS